MAAADGALAIQLRYARADTGLAEAALAGAKSCVVGRHYPFNDVSDSASSTRYYYHAHTSRRYPPEEHGHFHLFHYGPSGRSNDFVHIAGLSLDARGQTLRWFSTNRWVTGERWRSASHIERLLPDFRLQTRGRLAPVAEWLTHMVRLFVPEIARMVRRRDAILAPRIAKLGRQQALEDRRLDVVSECPALLLPKIQSLAPEFVPT